MERDSRFHKGDIVYVCEDLSDDDKAFRPYDDPGLMPEMLIYSGRMLVVGDVINEDIVYLIDAESGTPTGWAWADRWLVREDEYLPAIDDVDKAEFFGLF